MTAIDNSGLSVNLADAIKFDPSKVFGASKSEWAQIKKSKLVKYVLPVVSDKRYPIYGKLDKGSLGKVPSILWNGQITGFRNWPAHDSTAEELATWSKDNAYGFCVRTGYEGLIAVDCDCDDQSMSEGIWDLLVSAIDKSADEIPRRSRGNARWAILLRVTDRENANKLIVKLRDGFKVEFLGKGQQLVCCGTHPRGERYVWSGKPFVTVPECTEENLKNFIDSVIMLYGADGDNTTEIEAKTREKSESFKADDPIRDFLLASGRVLSEGSEGELFIDCPWSDEHTTDSGERQTVYFPKGSNGYAGGAFKCLHAHCQHRTIDDFTRALRNLGYEATSAEEYPDEEESIGSDSKKDIDRSTTIQSEGDAREYKQTESLLAAYRAKESGMIRVAVTTLKIALKCKSYIGYVFAYDTFTNTMQIKKYPYLESDPWENYTDSKHTVLLIERLEKLGFSLGRVSASMLVMVVEHYCKLNSYNSLKLYLDSNLPKWDGVKRASRFFADYCHAPDSEYNAAIGRYLFAMLYARGVSESEPVKADISIILVGPQGARKSTCVELLALKDTWSVDINMRLENKELAQRIQGKTCVEVGEMAGMTKKDADELKDFLTRKIDQWRPVYSREQVSAIRHCVFVMTTNNDVFLTDTTGNRRFACVDVRDIDTDKIKADIMQLWAEGKEIYASDGGRKLHYEIEKSQEKNNLEHTVDDPWDDKIASWLRAQEETAKLNPANAYRITGMNIMRYALEFSIPNIRQGDIRRMGSIMAKFGYHRVTVREKGEIYKGWRKI